MNLSNEVTINKMLRNGIRVYAYPGMTQVKAAVYDGWASLKIAGHPADSIPRVLDRVPTSTAYASIRLAMRVQ